MCDRCVLTDLQEEVGNVVYEHGGLVASAEGEKSKEVQNGWHYK